MLFCCQAKDALKEVGSINQEEEKQEPVSRSRIFEVQCVKILFVDFSIDRVCGVRRQVTFDVRSKSPVVSLANTRQCGTRI